MTGAFQASLLDCGEEVGPGPLGSSVLRTRLVRGAWVDVRQRWVTGADTLFQRLAESVPWQAERRRMYDRVVDVPRLLRFYGEGEALPDPALDELRSALNAHYAAELGEPFRTAGLCLYRDGRDSVAWHGDRIGRGGTEDTMVAIVSLGTPRSLLLRPSGGSGSGSGGVGGSAGAGAGERGAGGGPAAKVRVRADEEHEAEYASTLRHELGHGDLLVMGGSCQRTWEHAVPKTARPIGPRISVQFRPRGVR